MSWDIFIQIQAWYLSSLIFSFIEYNVSGEFNIFVSYDWKSRSGNFETYGSFVIECEGNRDKVVWKRVKEQPLVAPLGYWKKPFNYTISTTNSGKLVYHGGVNESDSTVPGESGEDDLVGSYEGHTVSVKDIIGKNYTRTFKGVSVNHKVVISIQLTKNEQIDP